MFGFFGSGHIAYRGIKKVCMGERACVSVHG